MTDAGSYPSPLRDDLVDEVAALVTGTRTLQSQAEALISKWESERAELPLLLMASKRSPELDRDIEAAATGAGMPVDRFRLEWISQEQSKRVSAIKGAKLLIVALDEGMTSRDQLRA